MAKKNPILEEIKKLQVNKDLDRNAIKELTKAVVDMVKEIKSFKEAYVRDRKAGKF